MSAAAVKGLDIIKVDVIYDHPLGTEFNSNDLAGRVAEQMAAQHWKKDWAK